MTLKELFNIWLNKYVKHTIKLRTFITSLPNYKIEMMNKLGKNILY